jgi:hypothetical protein
MGFALDGVYPTWGLPYMGFALGYMVFALHGVYPTWGLPYMGFALHGVYPHGVYPTWGLPYMGSHRSIASRLAASRLASPLEKFTSHRRLAIASRLAASRLATASRLAASRPAIASRLAPCF